MANDRQFIRQTAYRAAAEMTAAEVMTGILSNLEEIRSSFYGFAKIREERLMEGIPQDAPPQPRRSGGGQRRSSGGGSRSVDADTARQTKFTWGAFEGLSVGEVFDLSAEDAAKYGYGDEEN